MTDDKKSNQNSRKGGESAPKASGSGTASASGPSGAGSGPATPNRDRGREAAVIDAKPGDVREVTASAGSPSGGTGKAEAGKTEAGKADVGKTDVGKTDVGKVEAGKADAGKADAKPGAKPDEKTKPAVVAGTAGAAVTGAGAAASSSSSASTGTGTAKPPSGTSSSDASPSGSGSASGTGSGAPAGKGGASPSGSGSGSKPPSGSPPPAKSEPGKSGGGGAGLVAAALGGAAIALLAGWGFYTYKDIGGSLSRVGNLTAAQQKAAGEQDKKLAALSDKLTKQQETKIAALTKRLAALEAATKQAATDAGEARAAVAKLSATPAEGQGAAAKVDLGPLEKRIAAIENSLSAPKTQVRATGDRANTPESGKTADGGAPSDGAAPASVGETSGGAAKQIEALQARIDALAKQAATAIKPGTLDERLGALEKKIMPPADLAPVEKRIAELEKSIGSKLAPIASATQDNSKQIAATGAQLSRSVEKANAAATAVIARTLFEQVNSGAPYAKILGAAEALGADAGHVSKLKPHADKGLPTDSELASQFQALSGKLLAPGKPKENASLMDRLKAGASRLVTVRPVGETQGDTPAALVTRIGRSLQGGDAAGALALFGKLPEDAKAKAKEFAGALRTRVEAQKAVQAILDTALGKLGPSKS